MTKRVIKRENRLHKHNNVEARYVWVMMRNSIWRGQKKLDLVLGECSVFKTFRKVLHCTTSPTHRNFRDKEETARQVYTPNCNIKWLTMFLGWSLWFNRCDWLITVHFFNHKCNHNSKLSFLHRRSFITSSPVNLLCCISGIQREDKCGWRTMTVKVNLRACQGQQLTLETEETLLFIFERFTCLYN